MQKVNAFVLGTLHNPRFQGALLFLDGIAETSAGLMITLRTGFIAAPIGHFYIVHGIDHATTGLYSVVTGKNKLTATQLTLETAGVSSEIASIGDAALSITGFVMGAKAVSRLVTYPKYRLPPINPNDGYNRVAFEEWKVMLRKEMEKPFVVNAKLRKYADEIYKPHASIGNGSTAAAIREEFVTGEKVFDKLHAQKGKNMITCLERWLQNNPTASLEDRSVAENMIKDLQEALGE